MACAQLFAVSGDVVRRSHALTIHVERTHDRIRRFRRLSARRETLFKMRFAIRTSTKMRRVFAKSFKGRQWACGDALA